MRLRPPPETPNASLNHFPRNNLFASIVSLMPIPTYLPHVVYATALTSLALHLLVTKKDTDETLRRADARISLLDGLATRLRSGERVHADELARVQRLLGGDVDDEKSR